MEKTSGLSGSRPLESDLTARPPTVLLVDDDPIHRNIMAFDFKRRGYRVLQAGGGKEAWGLLLLEDSVNLVITDIRMPDGNGVELLHRIKERDSLSPTVILITGYTELNLADARGWGAEAVFPKPVDRKGLLQAAQAAMTQQGFVVHGRPDDRKPETGEA